MQNIAAAAKKVGKKVKVLLRINPDVDPQVGQGGGSGCVLGMGKVGKVLLCINPDVDPPMGPTVAYVGQANSLIRIRAVAVGCVCI